MQNVYLVKLVKNACKHLSGLEAYHISMYFSYLEDHIRCIDSGAHNTVNISNMKHEILDMIDELSCYNIGGRIVSLPNISKIVDDLYYSMTNKKEIQKIIYDNSVPIVGSRTIHIETISDSLMKVLKNIKNDDERMCVYNASMDILEYRASINNKKRKELLNDANHSLDLIL